jgi:hypothetical protein
MKDEGPAIMTGCEAAPRSCSFAVSPELQSFSLLSSRFAHLKKWLLHLPGTA